MENSIINKDGVYTWTFEYSLWKNPTILITIYKVLVASCLFVGLLLFVITLNDGLSEALKVAFNVFMLTLKATTGLLLIAYPLYCLLNGGKYNVVFIMDDNMIIHRQLKTQYDQNQARSLAMAMVGLLASEPTLAGASILSATKIQQISEYDKISKLVFDLKKQVIFINDNNGFNQIYAKEKDFEFVKTYILNKVSAEVMVVYK